MARYIALYLSSYHSFSFYLQVVVTSFFRVPLEARELLAVRSRLVLDSIYSSLMKISKSKLRPISHVIYGFLSFYPAFHLGLTLSILTLIHSIYIIDIAYSWIHEHCTISRRLLSLIAV